ncbi:acyloxyacyl hydrolase [Bosea minatitlanensis]|uniref:Acyloxyacyl hydrolase n=1 Tax=Bosea minatitlanensis TaxID=128782 RepID=A0ABW0F070_9HYPH|nr:acyloxyacyl hydrolase [Bosea minatitlanensis]MCT4492169.1 acyloxyacyl hydrolase [Bosea minatitlanensis]
MRSLQLPLMGALFLAALALLACEASAADLTVPLAYAPPAVGVGLISELRGGVLAHNPAARESGSADVNLEILFAKPFQPADPAMAFLVPRIHLGTTLNTAGDTSAVYAGFTWTYDFTDKLFAEVSAGAGFHNGKTGRIVPLDRIALGCSPLFRESASLGYRISQNWSVMATVEHMSNAGLCRSNPGITNYGLRLGYVF